MTELTRRSMRESDFTGDALPVAIHRGMMDALRLTPKDRWKARYREERMRAKGYPEREIKPPFEARVGTWQGVRFIERDLRFIEEQPC